MKHLIPILLFALAADASAATLYDGGIPLLNDAERSDVDNGNQKGDLFSVTTSVTLQGIQWWGIYGFSNSPQATDFFKARIYAVVNGVPVPTPLVEYTLPSVARQATTETVLGFLTVYSYVSVIPDTMLGPGNYVLSLMNDTTADANDSWFWANSTLTTGTAFERNSIFDAWSQFKLGDGVTPVPSHAFNISGFIVPEPTILSLLATASLGLAMQRRRRVAALTRR